MNTVDESRIGDTTKGAVVVDLDAYRASAHARSAAAPYLPPATAGIMFWFIIGALILFAFIGGRAR